ncbi:flagellar export chaperone FlgN [Anaerosacchariphilus polymeriproducens]|uniref:Flagellar protein FliT n=1 Tax=Anaerosacchariphilus polymeriproducens TaxID=1812858 RepID=A0A371AQP8_9FIRM|nr:flagellar export chaperone FlgN [Anaerosacchariphilus polymeriproducens]RDU21897.1 flagellar protein FliT [Anaerosacchariphilus polymeriproducens]
MVKNKYVIILIESLQKKIKVLDAIIEKNKEQKEIIKVDMMDTDQFENNIQEKAKLIDELNLLDEGFESIYNRVKEELTEKKDLYQKEIKTLQGLIGEITGKVMEIQAQEERNKSTIIQQFGKMRTKIKKSKASKNAALNYYKSMNKLTISDPQFLDRKK